MPTVLWLHDVTESDRSEVGAKVANLARARSLGLEVPKGFCLTTEAYALFVQENHLGEDIRRAVGEEFDSSVVDSLHVALRQARVPGELRQLLARAYHELGGGEDRQVSVAVRSSATSEDLADASAAGQYVTLLNVRGVDQLESAVLQCWASLCSPQALAYRRRQHLPQAPSMAILVQCMVAAEEAGVAFSRGPWPDTDRVVVEATKGLGEALVSGQVQPDRYVVSRESNEEVAPPELGRENGVDAGPQTNAASAAAPGEPEEKRVLGEEQVRAIARAAMKLESAFGVPQDMEWAWGEGHLWVLQSRPITAGVDSFFDADTRDDQIWTAAFLNERFPVPVSPLGWTLINELLEELAFRDPLRYLGFPEAGSIPITRLRRGHPYVNLTVFQTLYKVFPDQLLPEDAYRYFPGGETGLRRAVSYPRSLVDPRFLWSMMRHLLPDVTILSPWHNHRRWGRFAEEHSRRHADLSKETAVLIGSNATASELWAVISRLHDLNRELLALHRWTLTCTDLVYSLQRRMVRAWAKEPGAVEASTALVTGLPNRSAEMDRALHNLASLEEGSEAFEAPMIAFFKAYGHRSLYLDIYHPPLSARREQVQEWIESIRKSRQRAPVQDSASSQELMARLRRMVRRGWAGALKWRALWHVLGLTRAYMPLREDQRYAWQKALALQRELFLAIGAQMVRSGALAEPGQVFFLTKPEVNAWVQCSEHQELARVAAAREREFRRLCAEHAASPDRAYPAFLRGNQPLAEPVARAGNIWRGHGVSPGLGRGRVKILHSAQELNRVQAGDVLVAPGVDSAWTPVFGLLSGLVLEHGGQLSHAAIIAREYGLPTVAGIEGIATILKDGDRVLVDGLQGVVEKEEANPA